MSKLRSIIFLLSLSLLFAAFSSCDKDSPEKRMPPVISLDSETGLYIAKIGKQFSITPTIANGEDAAYRWFLNSRVIFTEQALLYTIHESGTYYVTLRVTTPFGQDEKEMRIDVASLAPPLISINIPEDGLKVLTGEVYTITPFVQNDENATYEWYKDGELLSNSKSYEFINESPGTYKIILKVSNEDGTDEKTIDIEVVDEFPVLITFLSPLYGVSSTDKTVFKGRKLYLRPMVSNIEDPTFSWTLENDDEVASTQNYIFQESSEGEYKVTLSVSGNIARMQSLKLNNNITTSGQRTASVTITVKVYGEEADGIKTSGNKRESNKVYEYLPAPGQFINEPQSGFDGQSSMAAAALYAQRRLEYNNINNGSKYISLGGFGGYIVVGFDHSIPSKGGFSGYDFSIVGNQFLGSSEPGIVWVMQDTNGNGIPDDEWYELRGSESGKPETIYDYAVTYFKPDGTRMPVQWIDNQGKSGSIDYLVQYHDQGYYYPSWIKTNSYTLYGTRLTDRTSQSEDGEGIWINGEFEWGYADNWGIDRLSESGNPNADPNKVYFKISNALYPDGTDANLQYIDFIKVQTAVNVKAGIIGENSTEVFGFFDEN